MLERRQFIKVSALTALFTIIKKSQLQFPNSKELCEDVYQKIKLAEYAEDLAALDLLDYLVTTSGASDEIRSSYELASQNSRLIAIESLLEDALEKSQLNNLEKKSIRATYQFVRAGEPINDFGTLTQLDKIIEAASIPTSLKRKYSIASATSRALTTDILVIALLNLETIERNAKLQTQLIGDLLDVSRILQGKLSLSMAAVNLAPTISAAIETVQLAAQAKSIQIETVFDLNVGQVLGDSARLQQVIWNLLSNAVKFTENGGRVEIRLGCVDSQAEIKVSDTGKGISPDFLPHVFESFRQADATITRKFGGLGLGLAIVRHLVELHGGTIYAESPGEDLGATFTVRLPLIAVVKTC